MNKTLIAILVILFAQGIYTQTCTKYVCNSTTIPYSNGNGQTCVFYNYNGSSTNSYNNLETCLPGFACYFNLGSTTNLNPSLLSTNNSFSNQYCALNNTSYMAPWTSPNNCYQDSDCATNNCTNGSCYYVNFNFSCSSNINCAQGLSCVGGICQKILYNGQNCSTTDTTGNSSYNLCVGGSFCVTLNSSTQATCVQAFSVGTNTTVNVDQNIYPSSTINIHFFCQSGYYGTSGCAQQAPTTNNAALPNMVCVNQSQCTANTTSNLTTYPSGYNFGSCNCNYANSNGQAFCSGNPGDQIYQTVFQTAKSNAQNLNSQMPNQAWAMCAQNYQNMTCSWSQPATPPVYASSNPQLTNFSAAFYTIVGDTTQSGANNAIVCPIYQFVNNGLIPNGTQSCLNQTSNSSNSNIYNISAQGCPSGYTCTSTSKTAASCTVSPNTLPNNNVCIKNGDCQSNYCNQTNNAWGVCAFRTLNNATDQCSSNLNCQQNQFCFATSSQCVGQPNCNVYNNGNNTCQTYIPIGGNCNSTTLQQCVPGSYCTSFNTNSNTSAQQVCTRLFSQAPGQQFSILNFTNNISNTDSSNQGWYNSLCASGSFNMSSKQCNENLETTNGGWPKVCNSYSDCQGIYGSTGNCQCQPNTAGTSYCQGFFGDHASYWNQTKTYWSNLQSQSQYSFQNCYWYQTLTQNSNSNPQCAQMITALTTLLGNSYYGNTIATNSLYTLQPTTNFQSSNYTSSSTPQCLVTQIWQYQIFNPSYVAPVPVTPVTPINNGSNPNNTQPVQPVQPVAPVGSATLIGTASSCPAYVCGSSQANYANPSCLTSAVATSSSSNQQQVQSCYKNFGCYLYNSASGQVSVSASTSPSSSSGVISGNCYLQNCAQTGYPSSTETTQCYRNSDCATGYCSSGSCSVQALGSSCTTQSCGVGLYCFQSTCQKILTSGSTCDSSTDSTSYQLCAQGSACVTVNGKSTCTLAYSVAQGTTVGFTGSAPSGWQISTICASGYAVNGVCTLAPATTGNPTFPLPCTQTSTCLAENVAGGIAGFGSCSCAYATTNGQAYCTGNPGDLLWKNAFQNANSLANSLNQKVASTAQYMCSCPYSTPSVCTWTPPTTVAYGPSTISLSCLSTTFNNLVGDSPVSTTPTITCPSYQCGNVLGSSSSWPNTNSGIGITTIYNNLCVYPNPSNQSQTIFAPNACPTGYTCFPTTTTTSTCPTQSCAQTTNTSPILPKLKNCTAQGPYQNLIGLNGQCLNNNDCITNYCSIPTSTTSGTATYGTCQLQALGSACSNNNQCPTNSVCNSLICTSYLAIGATCSQNNANLCPPNTNCVQQTGETIFTCQKYFSIPAGKGFTTQTATTVSTAQNSYIMCQSGQYNSSTSSSQQCAAALESTVGGWPKVCTSSSQCVSTFNNQANCVCQPNSQGNMYCQGFIGDWVANWAPYKNAWNSIQSTLNNGFGGCAWYQARTEYTSNNCNQFYLNQYVKNLMSGYLNGTWSIVPSSSNLIPSCYSSNFWNYKLIDPNTLDSAILKVATLMFLAIFLMFIFI